MIRGFDSIVFGVVVTERLLYFGNKVESFSLRFEGERNVENSVIESRIVQLDRFGTRIVLTSTLTPTRGTWIGGRSFS